MSIRNTIPQMRETEAGVDVSGYIGEEYSSAFFADDDFIEAAEALPEDDYATTHDLALEAAKQAAFILAEGKGHKVITHFSGAQLVGIINVPAV